ncbi:MAG TPA: ATP-dependent DNA helicase [Bryobacteraceae bacterium]|nr:ATP-dependent DNA helicase [Bryobacteraceae bacterium]
MPFPASTEPSAPRARKLTTRSFFARNGVLSEAHPNYEFRPGQLEMAEAIENALREKHHLIVEAGTGTGKTLAYLIPALLSGKRVIVSTGTKNLQEQLYSKDVPFLQSLFDRPLRVCYMKGRANYLCRQKLYNAEREPILTGLDEMRDFQIIREWEQTTQTGDRAELTQIAESSSTWWKLDARSDTCAGQKCAQFERCFITEMHRRAQESDIVIVNHHLFFADLAVRDQPFGAILPDYTAVVFDEAHEIEDVAGQYFGISVSNLQIQELIKDAAASSRRKFFATPELDRALIQLGDRSDEFFRLFPAEGRHGFATHDRFLANHAGIYRELLFALEALSTRLELVEGAIEEIIPLVRRTRLLKQALEFWMEGRDSSFVYWTEARGRGLYLQATPIDVSQILPGRLFEKLDTAILTSATLTVAGDFAFLQQRLGLSNAQTLHVKSAYDYEKQVLLYVPPHLPDPRDSDFTRRAADEIERILEITRGRAFLLFTSYAQMHQVYELLRRRLEYPLLVQGDAPRTALIERFRRTPGAVLFGTSSFWQGVDVQGEQLSCVIIDRLPFAVPSDPVVAARSEDVRSKGGNAFRDYQVPQAALALKQGFGRLIRASSDRGVLVLLDNRIIRFPYGRVFFESLPAYGFSKKLTDVEAFFHA